MSSNSKGDPFGKIRLSSLKNLLLGYPKNHQELLKMLSQCCRDGVLSEDSLAMIEGVFHVGEMRARDIMIPRSQMTVILKDASLEEIYKTVVESGHSRFPVLDEKQDSAEGFLLAKDLLRYCVDYREEDFQIKDHLRQPAFIPESKRLNVLLNEFRRTRNHMAIVVDEYGGIAGLMTIEDVLEQIVGDITDEHDIAEDQYIFDYGNGKYLVKALTPVEEFNNYFSSNLSDSSSDTVGGFIIKSFGYLPRRGEKKQVGDFLFEVNRADVRRVHFLLISRKS